MRRADTAPPASKTEEERTPISNTSLVNLCINVAHLLFPPRASKCVAKVHVGAEVIWQELQRFRVVLLGLGLPLSALLGA